MATKHNLPHPKNTFEVHTFTDTARCDNAISLPGCKQTKNSSEPNKTHRSVTDPFQKRHSNIHVGLKKPEYTLAHLSLLRAEGRSPPPTVDLLWRRRTIPLQSPSAPRAFATRLMSPGVMPSTSLPLPTNNFHTLTT